MKAKIIYGAPCSGKSTYVCNSAGDNDLIYDYDRMLVACTNRTLHISEKHALHWLILSVRKNLLDNAKTEKAVDTFWFICSWNTDYIKQLFNDIDTEEIFLETTKEECYARLDKDETRPDKDEWKLIIDEWFEKYAKESEVNSMKKRFWNWAKNEDNGERVLRLEGIIAEESWWDDEISPKQFREELNSGDGDITVWINSYGGDVFAGAQIFNMLKEYKGKVVTCIDGIAASAASVIAMAGDVVQISPVGALMIHDPLMAIYGNSEELKSAIKVLGEIKETIINAYELKTNLPRDKIAKMMTEETWMSAKKALELGFVDEILFTDNDNGTVQDAVIFSRMTVTNCLLNKIKSKNKPSTKKDVAEFKNRINLIKP